MLRRLRQRPEGGPFDDMRETDWQRASDATLNGEWGPFSIAADFEKGWLTADEAHELVLSWLNRND